MKITRWLAVSVLAVATAGLVAATPAYAEAPAAPSTYNPWFTVKHDGRKFDVSPLNVSRLVKRECGFYPDFAAIRAAYPYKVKVCRGVTVQALSPAQ